MNTVDELGRRFKKKYSGQYDHFSDVEAGRYVKQKHPGMYDDFIDLEEVTTALVEVFKPSQSIQSHIPDLPTIDYKKHHGELEKTVKELQTYYSPHQGRLSAWWNRGKAESRTKLLGVLKSEQMAILEQGALLEEHALKTARGRLEFEKFVATHTVELLGLKSQASVLEIAIREGLDGQSVVDINRAKALTDIELKRERELSQIKLDDYEGRKKIDNEAEREQHAINQDNISRVQQEALELIDLETKRLFKMYDDLAQLKESDDPAKEYKIIRMGKNIKIAEDALDAKQAKLIQNEVGQKQGGFDTDSDSYGSDRETSETNIQ